MVKMYGTYVLQPELQDKDVGQHQLESTCRGGEQGDEKETNVTRVVLTTEIELLRVVVVGLMKKRLVLAAAEKKSSTTERVVESRAEEEREAWLMQRRVVRAD